MRKKKPEAPKMRKVTMMLPADLIDRAMKVTGKGLTPTVRESLEQTARSDVYERLRALRGKLKIDLDLDRLREDRIIGLR
jgi:hypothetical protein